MWATKHGKAYLSDPTESAHRERVFNSSLEFIAAHNARFEAGKETCASLPSAGHFHF